MDGSWASLTRSVAAFAAHQTGMPGAPEALNLILALGGSEDEQTVMLRRIQRDVAILRMGPFHSAQEHLRTAGSKGRGHADYEYHLREAESKLIEAFGQAASTEELSVVTFNLALVEAVRGNAREAQNRLRESYKYYITTSHTLLATATDVEFVGSWLPIGTATQLVVMTIGAPASLIKRRNAKHAAIALKGYLPFVNVVAGVGNTVDRTAMQEGLRLLGDRAKRYELERTSPQYYVFE